MKEHENKVWVRAKKMDWKSRGKKEGGGGGGGFGTMATRVSFMGFGYAVLLRKDHALFFGNFRC